MAPAVPCWLALALAALATASPGVLGVDARHRAHHDPRAVDCDGLWRRRMMLHDELMAERRRLLRDRADAFKSERLLFDPFEATYTCPSLRRVTAFGDGGKFVCGEPFYFQSRRCLVYSVGVGGDSTFEKAVASNFRCQVFAFDPSGDTDEYRALTESTGATFHPWGLGPAAAEPYNNTHTRVVNDVVGLEDMQKRLGHAGRTIDILKVDCEGCEYAALGEVWAGIAAAKTRVGQVQVELHINRTESAEVNLDRIARFFDAADDADFMVFHKERNQWGCDGYICVEYALLSKAEARRMFYREHCRT